MQPTAGSDLPHTRSRSPHWLITGAALAALLAAAALVRPADAAGPAPGPPAGPDPTQARYPVDCGPWELKVTDRAEADFDADGQAETVAVVRCATGAGTPPSGMFVLAHPADPGGAPRVAMTLVEPADQHSVDALTVRRGTIAATLRGYSTPEVPRCCPDRELDVRWRWQNGAFTRDSVGAAGAPV
ncbi:hypothetical protein GCM10023347_16490 [Streptomyces chumphonensis]|uniref:Secreted protein n=1 Tax=Streptomyces chumphonensis TaxID=1214925 RepID=A0A927ICF1_9ACTN|nr:hypothetical protein [Streptomyces chumphonensis]MBD3931559.1 hypothetical protein [Streptomyces chumphonensis]